ncbi:MULTISPECIES: fimbrial protein [Cupriavidus]|uniref:fimbrial protein n=1 Tax=Cupriavidus TaxID=106589 RepID=UPI00036DB425|nr:MULTISPECIES: fimbrial protein [Cupriavidus]
MKNTLLASAIAAAAAAAAFAPVANAYDGTIEITGNIVATTCQINGSNGPTDVTVPLPPVSANALSTQGATAGRTPFSITLSGCQGGSATKVSTSFEAGPTVNSTGRLTVDAGGASGVEIRLLNATQGVINAGTALTGQNSPAVNIVGNGATLNYFAEYFATGTGTVTSGAANSRVRYSLVYE